MPSALPTPARPRPLIAAAAGLTLVGGLLAALPDQAHAADPLPIAAIQGVRATSPYVGQVVTTRPSVVTAVYGQASSDFRGFVIQTPGSGGRYKNLGTGSDAIFVYLGSTAFDVEIGDGVVVSGTVGEFKSAAADSESLTQIGGAVTITDVDEPLATPRPVTGWLWSTTAPGRENLESMLYFTREPFLVADPYNLRRFGEMALAAGEQAIQPTEVGPLHSIRAEWQTRRNAAIRVNLDDGTNRANTVSTSQPARQVPYLTEDRDVTVGDRVTLDEPVIIDWRNNAWKFNPTRVVEAGDEPATVRAAPADRVPNVGGAFSVASFNVLNYFTTLAAGRPGCTGTNLDTDRSFNVAADDTRVSGECDVRGAYDADDLDRQQNKIVAAINQLDASVVGLMEIENSVKLGETADEAVATLVAALNAAAGDADKWTYVASSTELQPVADQDAISNAFIYQPAEVRLDGPARALGSAAGDTGAFGNARTPLAASFSPVRGGESMIVVVNHFKSKSSGAGATGDNADTGQGAFNGDRTRQAQAVRDWLPSLQAAAGTNQVAVIGDLNAYSQEAPVRVFADAGLTAVAPDDEYSYVFAGLSGSLDHVLLNRAARQRMTRADIWNINSVESDAFEYATYKTTALDYYTADVRRASDHDPVIAGFRRGPR